MSAGVPLVMLKKYIGAVWRQGEMQPSQQQSTKLVADEEVAANKVHLSTTLSQENILC